MIPTETHAVRQAAPHPPAFFSTTVEPTRIMVVDRFGTPIGLATIRAHNTLAGQLTGYFVEFDDGSRMTVPPAALRDATNVVMPPVAAWALRRFVEAPFPTGGAA